MPSSSPLSGTSLTSRYSEKVRWALDWDAFECEYHTSQLGLSRLLAPAGKRASELVTNSTRASAW